MDRNDFNLIHDYEIVLYLRLFWIWVILLRLFSTSLLMIFYRSDSIFSTIFMIYVSLFHVMKSSCISLIFLSTNLLKTTFLSHTSSSSSKSLENLWMNLSTDNCRCLLLNYPTYFSLLSFSYSSLISALYWDWRDSFSSLSVSFRFDWSK